jgi:hypothetical protein
LYNCFESLPNIRFPDVLRNWANGWEAQTMHQGSEPRGYQAILAIASARAHRTGDTTNQPITTANNVIFGLLRNIYPLEHV